MRVAIWANSPSPHQADFYRALRCAGVDLRVLFLSELSSARRELGWSQPENLQPGEVIVSADQDLMSGVPDWRERIHLIPGYSRRVYWKLADRLSREGVPWVHWSECSERHWRRALSWGLKHWYARIVNRYALGAFAQGEMAECDFRRWGIRQEKISHLYYAVDALNCTLPPDTQTAEFLDGKTGFLFTGNLYRGKGCDVLLSAFANATSHRSDASLVIVGGGKSLSEYVRQAEKLGIADRVLFRGVVPRSEIGAVFRCANVFVLPSRYDGWGVVLNEAASAGLGLVSTDRVGAAYHLIRLGYNGFRVRAGSVASLTPVLRAYANDPDLVKIHGNNSRLVFDEFLPHRNVERFVNTVRAWLAAAGNLATSWMTEVSDSVKDMASGRAA